LVNARVNSVIFGAWDYKAGACGSVFNIADSPKLNHRIEVVPGVMQEECVKLLQDFFKGKRE
jgi:tRNA(adenine34) deaminase